MNSIARYEVRTWGYLVAGIYDTQAGAWVATSIPFPLARQRAEELNTPPARPGWLISQLRDRGICEICADEPSATEWAGTGQMIGWKCCEIKRAQYGN
jgi:hypothetical protein